MKKITLHMTVALVAACFSLPAAATLITFNSVLDANGVSTTAVAGATVVDFESGCGAYASCTGNGALVTGDSPGRYAAPHISATGLDDTTRYLTVPRRNGSGTVLLRLGTTANYFGLLWGSIDDYNTLTFLSGAGNVVASFTGSSITNPANGNQTAPSTNTYVNFFGLPTFDRVRLTSTNYAFESDNHAWATVPVPEPSTLGLLGLGLLGLGLKKRRRSA